MVHGLLLANYGIPVSGLEPTSIHAGKPTPIHPMSINMVHPCLMPWLLPWRQDWAALQLMLPIGCGCQFRYFKSSYRRPIIRSAILGKSRHFAFADDDLPS